MKDLISVKDLAGMTVETMFAAVPSRLVGDASKRRYKKETENLFYVLFGVHMQETDQYVVLSSIFKTTKTPIDGNYFKAVTIDTSLVENRQAVLDFIYDFVGDFTPHRRLVNEEILTLGPTTAEDAFGYLSEWNQEVFSYFNNHIKVRLFGADAINLESSKKTDSGSDEALDV
jgi:hypothetical protein